MGYQLEGKLLEVCDCNVLCPCWIGEDADNGTCDAMLAYHIDKGSIEETDVSGLTVGLMGHIPGNILKGDWRIVVFVDDKASERQQEAILNAWTGKLGGPLADMAKLVGEVIAVERTAIRFEVQEGAGRLRIGTVAEADMAPYRSPAGNVTTLNESVFSTIPGSPAYVAKASAYRRNGRKYGLRDVDLKGKNAIQGSFRFVA
ncbi:MAG: DUF1326 domain-containing protein [Bryobacterales bacterium]|nr:DUF1326 domain-containing protein [Bryobacterales bacterium]